MARTLCFRATCIAAGVSVAIGGLLAARVTAEPKPSPAPTAWEFKFKFDDPQRLMVKLPGEETPKTYWYMLYQVTNDTTEDREFLPVIERVAEIESELSADKVDAKPDQAPKLIVDKSFVGLDPAIFKLIKARHAKTHPFLISPAASIGRVKRGSDNALTSVAVFPDIDPKVSSFTIYVGGLSGETRQLPNPKFDAKKPTGENNPRYFTLQKTLALPYTLPGDPVERRTAAPSLGRINWVMR